MEEESCFLAVKGLIKDLLQRELPSSLGDLIDKIYRKIKCLEEEPNRGVPDAQVMESAINLWNWGVAKRTEDVITDEEGARVRHISCRLGCWCEGSERTEGTVHRIILMAMKTGKGWIDVGKPDLAYEFLEISLARLEKLYAMLKQRSGQEADVNMHRIHVEKDLFKVLTYQAEATVAQKDFKMATLIIQRCKDMLLRQPKETVYLSILCYNFGVETYEEKIYEQSSFWLSQSYEIGKTDERYSSEKEMQAKVLRLLATVFMEWDCRLYQDKALSAIDLANKEYLHPAGVFLKMKILLTCAVPDNVISIALTEMLHHELPLEVYLNTAKLLLEHRRDCVGFDFIKMTCKHFESSPDLEKARILHIELLLQRGKELLAQQKIEDLITDHYTGKQLSPESLNHLHIILWDCAAKCFERKNYTEALQWYNYSLNFYASGCTEDKLAKLHRNRASCYMHLKQLTQAKEAVKEAESCDPDNIFTQFSLYKLAMLENSVLEATNAVTAMRKLAAQSETEGILKVQVCSSIDLLRLAAQIALKSGQQQLAITALESLVEQSQDKDQVFISLRCLVRLVLSREDPETEAKRADDAKLLLSYLSTAHKTLSEPVKKDTLSHEKCSSEADWFRKIAWNLAVQNQNSPRIMRECFILSYKLSLYCPCDKPVLVAQKSCLLMAAALDLEMARKATDHLEQDELLSHSLENIELCREIWRVLQSTGELAQDPTEILLLLYEFEARAKLNDPRLETVFESIWELPNLEIKTLETIASLAMETPAYYPSLCKRALQGVLSLHKKQDPQDVTRLSKCFHSLVQLSLSEGRMELEPCAQEEVWMYFQEALAFITSCEEYPEIEIIWLMTSAWNTGILLYSVKKWTDAERWCALAMKLLSYLRSLKDSYENQMVRLYSEILERLEKEKGVLPNEE